MINIPVSCSFRLSYSDSSISVGVTLSSANLMNVCVCFRFNCCDCLVFAEFNAAVAVVAAAFAIVAVAGVDIAVHFAGLIVLVLCA